jgi:hypothetical protein
MNEPWVCPWAICNHDQAQACRAQRGRTKLTRGCGDYFAPGTTLEQAKKMIRIHTTPPDECHVPVELVQELRIEAALVPNRRGALYALAADEIERLRGAPGPQSSGSEPVQDALEKSARLMNETGQGEHLGVKTQRHPEPTLAEIGVEYRQEDGWHLFQTPKFPGVYVASRDRALACADVLPALAKLSALDALAAAEGHPEPAFREVGWVCEDGTPALLGSRPLPAKTKLYAASPEPGDADERKAFWLWVTTCGQGLLAHCSEFEGGEEPAWFAWKARSERK